MLFRWRVFPFEWKSWRLWQQHPRQFAWLHDPPCYTSEDITGPSVFSKPSYTNE
ncbi:unnamed protein product [Ectocarpus sp. CCAP 1310/34]|nr:unnamed protein product [Ectocarpus sp. CCAP 1310/34]